MSEFIEFMLVKGEQLFTSLLLLNVLTAATECC